MILRGSEWPTVYNSSGARGFYGEGYWFHDLWNRFGLDYSGAGFVSKTTTIDPRPGNMPIESRTWRPMERVPRCIVVKPYEGVVLNSVGLSGPGAQKVLAMLRHVHNVFTAPKIMVSFMAIEEKLAGRMKELQRFVDLFGELLENRPIGSIALQINVSCPNVEHGGQDAVKSSRVLLQSLENQGRGRLPNVPALVKLNALVDPFLAADISRHDRCDGIIASNTIPWGQLPDEIPWKKLFGSDTSPLAHLGGGGLSGKPLLPIVGRWIREARLAGLKKPIIAGGGILSQKDAQFLLECGADAIELGSVAILRPWRVQGIIKFVNEYTQSRHQT